MNGENPTQDSRELLALHTRDWLLENLDAPTNPGPKVASTCYVWPTDYCDVGCAHCNFASPRSLNGQERYQLRDDIERCLELVNSMGVWKAVLSGGGEPMQEPDFCNEFIHRVDSPDLDEIELITSGSFASTPSAAHRGLDGLVSAWRGRSSSTQPAKLTIRISVDYFHARRIGLDPAENILRVLEDPALRDVGVYLRSVLLDDDSTITSLADRLDGHLSSLDDYQQILTMPSGRAVVVYFKNLILDGRMTRRRLEALPVSLPAASLVSAFGERFRDGQGRQVPARTYNGPSVVHLEGLATILEASGGIKLLEGNHPARYPSIHNTTNWSEALGYLYADPITVALVEGGPDLLIDLIADERPSIRDISAETNQLYYLVEKVLRDPVMSLLATVRAAEHCVEAGVWSPESLGPVEQARSVWERLR